jgi:cardiolipin synthase
MRFLKYLPNLLTFLRLFLTPAVVTAILTRQTGWAILLFLIAAVSDVLDGWAARRFGAVTPFGAYWDPIADKFLMGGTFLALAAAAGVPRWFVVIVIGRDVGILLIVGILFLLTPLRKFSPSGWGKASTFVQICAAGTWMLQPWLHIPAFAAGDMLWISAAVTTWSGIDYLWRGFCMYRNLATGIA